MLLRNNLGLSLALSGQHAEAIEMLRAVVDEPGAKARNRQNLALAYGLAGDLDGRRADQPARPRRGVGAEQPQLLSPRSRAVGDQRKRAAVLGVHPPELTDAGADVDASRRIAAIALEGDGVELGLAPSGRWFVDLGELRQRPERVFGVASAAR